MLILADFSAFTPAVDFNAMCPTPWGKISRINYSK
jgi:hypothetical protein